jgi:hypothetical protein
MASFIFCANRCYYFLFLFPQILVKVSKDFVSWRVHFSRLGVTMRRILLFLFAGLLHCAVVAGEPVVLLRAFDDALGTGRSVAGKSEREVTLQLAQAVAQLFDEDNDAPVTYLVNPAGVKKNNLETLQKINQIGSAVAIQFTASSATVPKPKCSLFYRCYNPLTDQIKRPYTPLTPLPFEEVYLPSFGQSKVFASLLHEYFQDHHNVVDVARPAGLPLAGVRGVRHPLVQIEITVNSLSQINELAGIIAPLIQKLVRSIPTPN